MMLLSDKHLPSLFYNMDRFFSPFAICCPCYSSGYCVKSSALHTGAPILIISTSTFLSLTSSNITVLSASLDLPKAKVIDVEGVRIGAAHGEVYPRADTQQLLYLAKQLDVNILVTGHSHQPKIESVEDVLLLNPGSPIVPRLADRTVMLLEINNKEVDVEIVKIGAPVCSALDFDKFKRD